MTQVNAHRQNYKSKYVYYRISATVKKMPIAYNSYSSITCVTQFSANEASFPAISLQEPITPTR